MVYGFAKQSGGHLRIYSEPGHGTSVRLYLPLAASAPATPEARSAAQGGSEKILVVEDDENVRQLVIVMLESLGYQVAAASDGREALAALEGEAEIDLLFTDVVMPRGVSGRELADRAVKARPGLKVLFTSGYTENAIIHHGRLDEGVHLLSKPYQRDDLARKVREVLDG
jgi:CheY-like chemotaxis protein